MSKAFTLIAVYFYCITTASAQQGSIKGKITGLNSRETVLVNLLKGSDQAIFRASISEEDGNFRFDKLPLGKFILYINEMGYQPFISDTVTVSSESPDVVLKDITLLAKTTELKEVVVSAPKAFVTRSIDRVIINPDALAGNAGSTALELLEKAPGLLVDVNGNISMKGKPGVVVFIDDKPTYLSSEDLANYLRSLPSGSIASVELMTNPPAKYDASGNAGIINIRLKKNTARGVNGGVNLSYGQGRYARTNNSFNINYRINKLKFFANAGINQNRSFQDLTINRYYYTPSGAYNSGFTQNSYIKSNGGSRTARVGVDYYLTKRSTIGAGISGFINPFKNSNDNKASVLDASNETALDIRSYTSSTRKWKNISANANYTLKIDEKGKELTANADYVKYKSAHSQSLINDSFLPGGSLTERSVLNSSLPSDILIQSIKVDYAHPVPGIGNFDAGAKYSNVETDNNALFYDFVNNANQPNYEFTNRFQYKEKITAGHINYANNWKKIAVQLGLRVENTHADGYQFGNEQKSDSAFVLNYTNLFPTAYVLYQLDSVQKHQIGLSLGRRISRPSYQNLNPFTYPIDRYTYYGGNPFLQPTFSYNLELSYTYKNFVTTTFEYSIVKNLIQETNEQRGTIYYSRPGNFGDQRVYGLTVNGNFTLSKWWTLQLYSEFKNIDFNTSIYGQPLVENKWYWYVGPVNQFKINDKIAAELGGSYQTRILSGQFLTIPVWQMRAGVSWKILKNNGTLRLSVSDLFYTNQPGGDIRNIANSRANWLSYLDSRVATLGFSYRFNKGKSLKERQSGASDTEKSRVKL